MCKGETCTCARTRAATPSVTTKPPFRLLERAVPQSNVPQACLYVIELTRDPALRAEQEDEMTLSIDGTVMSGDSNIGVYGVKDMTVFALTIHKHARAAPGGADDWAQFTSNFQG